MFYIEDNKKIVLFDENRDNIERTLVFMPQYSVSQIKETDRPIENFEFTDTDEYKKRKADEEKEAIIEKIKLELSELDSKRIRAICENEIKDETTGQTWLDYYNSKVKELRAKLAQI